MKILKYLLPIIILLSFANVSIEAQKKKKVDDYLEIPKKRYRLSSGESTIIVNKISSGVDGEDAKFLFPDDRFKSFDLYKEDQSKYKSLEEATYEINRLLVELEEDTEMQGEINRSLSYRVSKAERMKKKTESKVKSMRDSLLERKNTWGLAELDAKFGNKPTYYINGIESDPKFVEYLYPDEILGREIKVTNTKSGNPNGEIWYTVSDRVILQIGLLDMDGYLKKGDPSLMPNFDYGNTVAPSGNNSYPQFNSQDSYTAPAQSSSYNNSYDFYAPPTNTGTTTNATRRQSAPAQGSNVQAPSGNKNQPTSPRRNN